MATTSDADSTASNAERRPDTDASVVSGPDDPAANQTDDDDNAAEDESADSSSAADKLATAAHGIWVAFLAAIVVFTLIPVVAVLVGVAPFSPPNPTPYVALVGLAVVGTIALVGAELYGV